MQIATVAKDALVRGPNDVKNEKFEGLWVE